MADRSAIEWTEATWNPVTGCDKVSPGCAHCYAERFAECWRGIRGHPYEQGFDLRLWPDRLDIPLRWRRSRVVFVNSMSDLFHERIPPPGYHPTQNHSRVAGWRVHPTRGRRGVTRLLTSLSCLGTGCRHSALARASPRVAAST